ncbi:Folliculin-interacting protein middle domain [Trinorchestia longiramus]|nr:Folliculin-interacting protein middle domain [Trinorchestia longiramus]
MTFLCPRIVLPEDEISCNATDLPRSCVSDSSLLRQVPPCGGKAECDVSKSPTGLNFLVDIFNKSPETFSSFLFSFHKSRSWHCLVSDNSDDASHKSDCGVSPCSDQARQLAGDSKNRQSPQRWARGGPQQSSRGFDISSGGIRVLLFRECERRGRKLLYDSNTVLRVPATSLSFADHSAPLTTAPVRGLTPLSLRDVPSEASVSSMTHPKLSSTGASSSRLHPSSSSRLHPSSSFSPKGLAQSLSLGTVLSSTSSAAGSSKPASGGNKGASLEALGSASKSSDPLSPGLRASGRPCEPRKHEIIMEITDDYVYQYCRQASDSKLLGELVFGCVQLAYRGSCSKLHTLADRIVLSRTQPRPQAPSRNNHPPLPLSAAHRHPTLTSDAGISSMGSSLDVLGRRISGAEDPSASSVSFYLGGNTDRRLPSSDKRSNMRAEGAGLRRTSTTVSDMRSSVGGCSVLGSTAAGMFPESAAVLRRTSTTPSEDDSGFGGPASWFSSHGGSFMGLLSLPVTPVGSVSSKGSLNSSSGSLSNLQKRFLRRTVDTSLDCLTGPSAASFSPQPRDGDSGSLTTKSSSFKCKDSPKQSSDTPAQSGVGVAADTGSAATAAAASHTRIGLAVVLSAEANGQENREREALERWVVLHSSVLEGCINRLQAALDLAYHNTSSFVSRSYAAVSAFQREVFDLLYGPRLISPVWLQLLSSPESYHLPASCDGGRQACAPQVTSASAARVAVHRQEVSRKRAVGEALVNSLGLLLREHDTKQTNFFMSRLLTAVLTYHLGWVTSVALQQDTAASVSPGCTQPQRLHSCTLDAFSRILHALQLLGYVGTAAAGGGSCGCDARQGDAPPSCPPFQQPQENESGVLTQLLELQGCLGSPPQCSRTVLLGSSASLLQHCLSLLSYFIRCQQVEERNVFPEHFLDLFREDESEALLLDDSWNPDHCDASVRKTPAGHEHTGNSCKDEAASESKSALNGINGLSRNSSEATLQRSLSNGSCRRSSRDSDRRSSGDSNGRRSSSDSNGRRSSGDSNSKRLSGESNSSITMFPSSTLHRKRPSIQSCAGTALETLSELPSAEAPHPVFSITDIVGPVTQQVQPNSFVRSQPESTSRDIDERHLGDLTALREAIHPCENAPSVTCSGGNKHIDSTQLTIGWQICPSKDSQAGSRVQFVHGSNFRTSSYSGPCELENLDLGSSSNISARSPVSFRKSKTSFNLACPAGSSKFELTGNRQKSDEIAVDLEVSHTSKLSGSSSDTSTLYPDLTTLDCHREVFGPAELQPDVIAAKVRKLCRVTPERLAGNLHKALGTSEVGSVDCVPDVKSNLLHEDLPSSETQEVVKMDTSGTKVSSKAFSGEVRFCGEMIRSEPEDGKKVIFIVGEDECLDRTSPSTASSSNKLRRSCSPHPDFFELKESRNVARALCLDELTRKNFTGVYRSGSERRFRRDLVLGHKRTSSDPTVKRHSALTSAASHPVTTVLDAASAYTKVVPSCVTAPVTSLCSVNTININTRAGDVACSSALTSICSLGPLLHVTSDTPTLTFSVPPVTAHSTVSCEVETTLASSHYSSTSDTKRKTVSENCIALSEQTATPFLSRSQSNSEPTGLERDDPTSAFAAASTSSLARTEGTQHSDLNFDCTFLSEPLVTVLQEGPVLGVAESVMGGVLDRYSPVFLLQGVINTDLEHFNSMTSHTSSTTASSPHTVPEGSMRSSDILSSSYGRPSDGLMTVCQSSSSSSLEREVNANRGAPSGHATLSFASSLFGTSPTRLFSGLSVKNPLASGTTDRRTGPGVCYTGLQETVRGASETAKSELLRSLRHHLEIDMRYSQLKANRVAILADLDDWSVRVVTSDSDGIAVGMSPLIASITDSLLQLVLLGAQSHTVLQCLEDKLGEVYRQSLILANYLLGGTTVHFDHRGEFDSSGRSSRTNVGINPGRLADLPSALGLDLNDLPLLLATASSHSPHLATMYGLAIR